MARCGCAGTTCSCVIVGSTSATVTGSGSSADPYVVTGPVIQTQDTDTIDLTLSGDGSPAQPLTLSGQFIGSLDTVADVDTPAPTAGQVLGWTTSPTPAWRPIAPTTAPAGSISVNGQSLSGDGSAGAPLAVKVQAGGGIQATSTGLKLSNGPVVATSSTRPSTAGYGSELIESNTGLRYWWDGTYWLSKDRSMSSAYSGVGWSPSSSLYTLASLSVPRGYWNVWMIGQFASTVTSNTTYDLTLTDGFVSHLVRVAASVGPINRPFFIANIQSVDLSQGTKTFSATLRTAAGDVASSSQAVSLKIIATSFAQASSAISA